MFVFSSYPSGRVATLCYRRLRVGTRVGNYNFLEGAVGSIHQRLVELLSPVVHVVGLMF